MITKEYISKKAAEHGFSAAYCCRPHHIADVPESVQSLVLLLRAYQPEDGLVDAFYEAKNASYFAAMKMMEEIEKDCSVKTCLLSNCKLKPLATQIVGLSRGLNTLNYHPDFGSKFCMELIGFHTEIEDDPLENNKAALSCASCGRCMSACPGGAITENGFEKEKCIRFYMMNGKPMPEHLRPFIGVNSGSYGVIGCDICQRICPGNAHIEKTRLQDASDHFLLEDLLVCTAETLERFGALYGRNYAVRNRIIAQALLAAGNTGDMKYLPYIEPLTSNPSPTVKEHACWAAEKIKKNSKNY